MCAPFAPFAAPFGRQKRVVSNHPRRRASSQPAMVDLLGPLDGARIPGGCDTCNAYQTAQAITEGVWTVTVHHDATCPTLQAMEAHQ